MDYGRTPALESTFENHACARNYPAHVEKYLEEELHNGTVLGPLDLQSFDLHLSPLMTRDKSSPDCFLKGFSVNDGVLKDS